MGRIVPDKPGKNAIEVRGVRKVFGTGEAQVAALDSVSVSIRENEFFTLLGPSGCGKTTLLRLIAGFDFPSERRDPALRRRHRAAAALQAAGQHRLPELRAVPAHDGGREYRLRPGDARQAEERDRRARRRDAEAGAAWRSSPNRRTSQISGGQQQRVALARALAPQPKVLLLDEPLSALDYKLRKEMQIELKRLQHETGITFIFVTHDQEEALAMSDRIAVMSARQDPAGRLALRHLRPAGRAFRRRFHRRDQFPRRRGRCRSTASAATVALSSGAEVSATFPAGTTRQRHASRSWSGRSTRRLCRAGAGPAFAARSRTSSISAPTRIST